MVMNLLWRTPPARTGITKTSDALLLLGIYAYEGQACTHGPRPKRSNAVELLCTIRMRRPSQLTMKQSPQDLVMRQYHAPGDQRFVDYAGNR